MPITITIHGESARQVLAELRAFSSGMADMSSAQTSELQEQTDLACTASLTKSLIEQPQEAPQLTS